jgi:phage terminase large subunit-like protein
MNNSSSPTSSMQSLSDVPTPTLQAIKRLIPWRNLRRPKQVPPDGDWLTWLILSGRGWGKTRVGAEWVLENSERYGRFVLAGRTSGDLRDIMIEGESGILNVAQGERPKYEPSKRRLTFPSGSVAVLRSADEPEGFRGIQAEAVWADELAAWEYPEAWDQMQMGFRLGFHPRQIVTTTPRPTQIIRDLMADRSTVVTVGSTYENRANLTESFLTRIVQRYEGTRLGRQELHGEILDDIEGALWRRSFFHIAEAPLRYHEGQTVPEYRRIVVAIDPAVSYGPESDETGIIAAGVGIDGEGYVLDDQSGRFSPLDWARRAIALHDELKADAIVAEVNNGGDLVEANLRSAGFAGHFIKVTASRGKRVRAEPVAGFYEQGRIHHVRAFPVLEDQLCSFTPESIVSPDRLDALVWAFTELMVGPVYEGRVSLIA